MYTNTNTKVSKQSDCKEQKWCFPGVLWNRQAGVSWVSWLKWLFLTPCIQTMWWCIFNNSSCSVSTFNSPLSQWN
jgi:hypothetical protein